MAEQLPTDISAPLFCHVTFIIIVSVVSQGDSRQSVDHQRTVEGQWSPVEHNISTTPTSVSLLSLSDSSHPPVCVNSSQTPVSHVLQVLTALSFFLLSLIGHTLTSYTLSLHLPFHSFSSLTAFFLLNLLNRMPPSFSSFLRFLS